MTRANYYRADHDRSEPEAVDDLIGAIVEIDPLERSRVTLEELADPERIG